MKFIRLVKVVNSIRWYVLLFYFILFIWKMLPVFCYRFCVVHCQTTGKKIWVAYSWGEWGNNNLLVSEWEAVRTEWKSIKWCFKEKINEFDEMPVIYKRNKTFKRSYNILFMFIYFLSLFSVYLSELAAGEWKVFFILNT